jgi:hypothetical protein|tara:strand:- start:27 stop:344 length:318 start_codon:yes stop_codon:yes gene_type:complete
MNFIWCHGTGCHKSRTQDRVRGSKGSKVLRTRKVKQHEWNRDRFDRFFCSQGCLHDFIQTHIQRIVALDPRTEPLETPINDPVKDDKSYYGRWNITEKGVDTSME